jgi:hypothetical protein
MDILATGREGVGAAEISLHVFKYNREEALTILIMSRSTAFVALLLLVSLASAQFTCSQSTVDGIASGVVRLGVPTQSVAQTSFSQSLTDFNLGTFAQVHAAFAIAGLEASSTQTYYSLIVDEIIFSNGNTLMNFTMNYNSPDASITTTWTTVKLSWVAISNLFESYDLSGIAGNGLFSWAGSVGITDPSSFALSGPVIANSIW